MYPMAFDDSDSRRAAEFDSYRRELVLHAKTVSGERRELWFSRLQELVKAMFPDIEANVRKPGLATRLFSIEVSLPHQDKMHLLDLATELDDNWRATLRDEVKGGASCVYRDRLDAIWEWVIDLGDCYVTGHVKLRNFNFDRGGDRPERSFDKKPFGDRRPYGDRPQYGERRPYGDRPQGDRPSYGDRRPYGDRPPSGDRPPYGDRKPYGDRPPSGDRPPYGDRKPYGDRPPSGDRPPYGDRKPYGENRSFGDRKPYGENRSFGDRRPYGAPKPYGDRGRDFTSDRSQTPSDGSPELPKRPPFPKPYGKSGVGKGGGYPKFGGAKKVPFRPKHK